MRRVRQGYSADVRDVVVLQAQGFQARDQRRRRQGHGACVIDPIAVERQTLQASQERGAGKSSSAGRADTVLRQVERMQAVRVCRGQARYTLVSQATLGEIEDDQTFPEQRLRQTTRPLWPNGIASQRK